MRRAREIVESVARCLINIIAAPLDVALGAQMDDQPVLGEVPALLGPAGVERDARTVRQVLDSCGRCLAVGRKGLERRQKEAVIDQGAVGFAGRRPCQRNPVRMETEWEWPCPIT